jgi:hypothetical protein
MENYLNFYKAEKWGGGVYPCFIHTSIMLSVFTSAGIVYKSVMSFFPRHPVHDDATFRCYLKLNLNPVGEQFRATYQLLKTLPPNPEVPCKSFD